METWKILAGVGGAIGAIAILKSVSAARFLPNVDISKWSDPASISPGGSVINRMRLMNIGGDVATNIMLVDTLFKGGWILQDVRFVDCIGEYLGAGYFSITSELPAGAQCGVEYTITAPLDARGLYQNEVNIAKVTDRYNRDAPGKGRVVRSNVFVI